MKNMNRIIKNLLRVKNMKISANCIDDDELFDYCIKRNYNYGLIRTELVNRGYDYL